MYREDELKEKDKTEIESWKTIIKNAIANAVDDYDDDYTFVKEVIDNFVEVFKGYIKASIHDVIIGMIEGYDDDNAE